MAYKWYIVHVQSGKEFQACEALKKRVENDSFTNVENVFVPTYKETVYKNGKKKFVEKKSFPGYIYIHMDYSKEIVEYCLQTPYISQFVQQGDNEPQPVSDSEVNALLKAEESAFDTANAKQIDFNIGQKVLVIDGPFNNFNGVVKEIFADKRKVCVNIEIFGRITPVEIDYFKVKKV